MDIVGKIVGAQSMFIIIKDGFEILSNLTFSFR